MFRLIPREEKFFDLFEESARNVERGAQALADLMERGGNFVEGAARIKAIESEGDRLTHEAIRRLNQTFVTPIDREDIYALVAAMDDVLDLVEATAARLALYEVTAVPAEANSLARLILRSAEQIVAGLPRLRRMEDVMPYCVELNRLENEADEVLRGAIAALFSKRADPIEILKWKEIYETLESATDKCEDVANILEGVLLKHA
jgi:predicted phosphate transport protein (TIGR00153 family)